MQKERMDRKEALKYKAIFYSKPFVEKFGDWISAGTQLEAISKGEPTVIREGLILLKYKLTIPLDNNFEPMLTPEVWEFVQSEYERIFNGDGELEVFDPDTYYS